MTAIEWHMLLLPLTAEISPIKLRQIHGNERQLEAQEIKINNKTLNSSCSLQSSCSLLQIVAYQENILVFSPTITIVFSDIRYLLNSS